MKTYNVTLEVQSKVQVVSIQANSSADAANTALNLFDTRQNPVYIHKVRRDYSFTVTLSIVSIISITLLVLAL